MFLLSNVNDKKYFFLNKRDMDNITNQVSQNLDNKMISFLYRFVFTSLFTTYEFSFITSRYIPSSYCDLIVLPDYSYT